MLFPEAEDRRIFGVECGLDFANAVVDGLLSRLPGDKPDALPRVTLLVNTSRMKRALIERFAARGAMLLPRIGLVTDLAALYPEHGAAEVTTKLRRKLDLAGLIAQLLEAEPTLAPASATYDLADSLAETFDEMAAEGVSLDALEGLSVPDQSGHWQTALRFLRIAAPGDAKGRPPTAEEAQRAIVSALTQRWADAPPTDPVLVVGSTGSRGTTRDLMVAVSRLPQGGIILPGVDFSQPDRVWATLADPQRQDHPQHRFAALTERLDMPISAITRWGGPSPVAARNALISLALRPAPVTSSWRAEGPKLDQLDHPDITVLEAPDHRSEARAIALGLRDAALAGRTAALITPDRTLARRVGTVLSRWDITPDDSAGQPLALTAPGRLLLMLLDWQAQGPRADTLIAL
ncbi:MAG: double-strand break repair protein AddB, partial [Shimia sp.]